MYLLILFIYYLSLVYYIHIVHKCSLFFFFNDTATTEIYTLSLHDALPISDEKTFPMTLEGKEKLEQELEELKTTKRAEIIERDRKSTRLNSSHANISYAVFCLKKKKNKNN